jgi:hypothetical protein
MISAALLVLAMAPGVADPIFQTDFDDPEGCPGGRQVLANIAYGACVIDNVDVTQWSNIWGYDCSTGDTVPFPGVTGTPSGDPTILNFGRTTYIAAHLHVPDDLPQGTYGWLVHTEYNYGADMTSSFSANCGDFNPPNPLCKTVATSGMNLTPWRVGAGNFCPLAQGHDYYLNLKFTDPEQGTATCPSDSSFCAVGIVNNVSPH